MAFQGSLATFFAQPAIAVLASIRKSCESPVWCQIEGMFDHLSNEISRVSDALRRFT